MTDTSDIYATLQAVLAEHLGAEKDQVQPNTHLVKDLDADSLDTVDVAMAVSDEFGVEVRPVELAAIQTVGDVQTLLENKLADANQM